MRGSDQQQSHVFSYISPEQRVRKDHPLRAIRTMVDKVLKELSPEFNKMYSKVGRPSIPPEQLLRALLLQSKEVRNEECRVYYRVEEATECAINLCRSRSTKEAKD